MRSQSAMVIGLVAILGVIGGVTLMTQQQIERRCAMIGTNVNCASARSYPHVVLGAVFVIASLIVGVTGLVAVLRSRP